MAFFYSEVVIHYELSTILFKAFNHFHLLSLPPQLNYLVSSHMFFAILIINTLVRFWKKNIISNSQLVHKNLHEELNLLVYTESFVVWGSF